MTIKNGFNPASNLTNNAPFLNRENASYQVEYSYGAGASNTATLIISLVDGLMNPLPIDGEVMKIWLSDSAAGVGLTATTASGAVGQGLGEIASVAVTVAGTYTTVPAVSVTSSFGVGAELTAYLGATAFTIVAAGTNYDIADTFTIGSGTFTTAAIGTISAVGTTQLGLGAAGTGYQVGDQLVLAPIDGTYTIKPVIIVDGISGGGISEWHLINNGIFTTKATGFTQFTTTGLGTGATFTPSLWGAAAATVNTAGAYSVIPTGTITPSASTGGTGITVTATFGVSGITVVDGGAEYSNNDSVVFASGIAAANITISATNQIFGTLTAKKALIVQSSQNGIFPLSIVDVEHTGFYICAQIPYTGQVFVSRQLTAADYN